MAREPRTASASQEVAYNNGVFINCPFDTRYQPMFNAIMFAVSACGLTPHAALEIDAASTARLDRIGKLIGDCRWAIHDISRVELNANGLPRFNMPFELGFFFGAKRFGSPKQRQKSCLVLDSEPFRYRQFISDISGQDITPHGNDIGEAISAVRGWMSSALPAAGGTLPGGRSIFNLYSQYEGALPGLCAAHRIKMDEMTYVDRVRMATAWLRSADAIPAP